MGKKKATLLSNKVTADSSKDESESENDESGSEHDDSSKEFCHYNENDNSSFSIDVFDQSLDFIQSPNVSELGIGGCVWDSSIILTKYIELHSSDFSASHLRGKRVLELGAGCGLAGMPFLMKGCQVTFTDLPIVVERITRPNVLKNYKRILSSGKIIETIFEPQIQDLDWFNWDKSLCAPVDYLLLTDCVFSEEAVNKLLEVLLAFSNSKTIVYCLYEARDEALTATFLSLMKQHFTLKDIKYSAMHPQYRSKIVKFFQAKRKRT